MIESHPRKLKIHNLSPKFSKLAKGGAELTNNTGKKMIYPKVDDILLSSHFFHEIRHYKLLGEGNFTQGYRIHEQGHQIGRIYGDCLQLFWLAGTSDQILGFRRCLHFISTTGNFTHVPIDY